MSLPMTNSGDDHHVPTWLTPAAQPFAMRLAAVIVFIIVVSITAWRIVSVLHVPPATPGVHQGLTDFHNSVYFPAVGFRDGYNPYSLEYVNHYPTSRLPPYSPAMFWLLYPFSMLPLPAADVAYFTFSCSLVIALAASALVFCRVPRTLVNVLGLATLIMLSRPGHINLLLGQITLIVVLGALWALELAYRKPVLGGVALAFTSLKPTFAVPLIWLMLCRRDFRTAIVGIAIGGLAAAAGFAPLVANHGIASVADSLLQSEAHLEADEMVAATSTWTRIDCVALVGKLFDWEPDRVTQVAIFVTGLLVAGGALWVTNSNDRQRGVDSLSALIVCTATLACVYHSTYCALLLVGPWLAVSVGRLGGQLPASLRAVLWLLITVPAVNYLSSRVVMTRLGVEEPLLKLLTMANGVCIAATLMLSIAVAVRCRLTSQSRLRQRLASSTSV